MVASLRRRMATVTSSDLREGPKLPARSFTGRTVCRNPPAQANCPTKQAMTTALGVVSLTPSIRLVFEEASSAKQGTVHGKPSSEWPPSPNGDQPTARSRPIGVGVVTGRVDVGWQHQQRGGCHATEPDHRPADPGPLPPWPWRPAHRDALAVQQRRRPRPAVAVGGDLKEVQSLPRPAMTYLRGQRCGRPTVRLARGHRRWLHPTRGRQPGEVVA
jgi:hypothetical protein